MSGESLSRRRMMLATLAAGVARSAEAAAEHQPHVAAVVFSPDGEQLVTGSQRGVEINDPVSGAKIDAIESDLESVHDLQFSPDGQWLAIAGGIPGESGAVELRKWPSGDLHSRMDAHGDLVYCVDFSADGSRLLTASADEVCSVYDINESRVMTRFIEHSREATSVVALPDDKHAVSSSRDETLRVWNLNTGENVRTLHIHSRDVHALALRTGVDGLPMVASASADQTVRYWQPTIGRMVRFIRLPAEPLDIAWFDHGRQTIAVCKDGNARIIDPVSVQVTKTLDVSEGWLFAVSASPTENRRLAIGGARGRIETIQG